MRKVEQIFLDYFESKAPKQDKWGNPPFRGSQTETVNQQGDRTFMRSQIGINIDQPF